MPKKKLSNISQSEVRRLFDYDTERGLLIWKCCNSPSKLIGKVAGSITKRGYRVIRIGQTQFSAHRLVFIYHHGEIRDNFEVDHRDRDKSKCEVGNLRLATHSQNNFNKPNRSKISYTGVFRHGERFRAKITKDYRQIHLGVYDTPEEAYAVYKKKAVELFGEFAKF